MITIVHAAMMLGLIVLPLLRMRRKKTNQPVNYKIDRDTTNAHYAVNSNGYLEKAATNHVID